MRPDGPAVEGRAIGAVTGAGGGVPPPSPGVEQGAGLRGIRGETVGPARLLLVHAPDRQGPRGHGRGPAGPRVRGDPGGYRVRRSPLCGAVRDLPDVAPVPPG